MHTHRRTSLSMLKMYLVSCKSLEEGMAIPHLGESHGQRSLAGYRDHGVTRVRHDSVTKPPPHTLGKASLLYCLFTKQEG